MKVHVVDGTYELFRAYYGAPSASGPDGREVGAARALMRSLFALCSEADVTHVGVAFDTVIESFRNDLFDGYKTGDGIEPELRSQFEIAERVAEALGLVVWRMVEHEADDALATAAARFGDGPRRRGRGHLFPGQGPGPVRPGPSDRLPGPHAPEDTRRGDGVRAKFGVSPRSIPDWLALVGDSADGIPGIPRWGAKSSAALLSAYEHLDRIPDDPDAWSVRVRGAAALARELTARRTDALLYRTLATLREDAPVPESLDELRWAGPRLDAAEAVCQELGDEALLGRLRR